MGGCAAAREPMANKDATCYIKQWTTILQPCRTLTLVDIRDDVNGVNVYSRGLFSVSCDFRKRRGKPKATGLFNVFSFANLMRFDVFNLV